jgi:FtsH-binding integral membrane protein
MPDDPDDNALGHTSDRRPRLLWVARGLFVGSILLLGALTVIHVGDTVGRTLFALVFVIMIAAFVCGAVARRSTEADARHPGAAKRRGFRIALIVVLCVALAGLAALPLVPMGARLALLPAVGVLVVVGLVLQVFAQPTRRESGQTDLSKPSPRARVGLAFLVMLVLMIVLPVVQHAVSGS